MTTWCGTSGRAGVILGALPASLNQPGGLAFFGGRLAISTTAENAILILP